MISRSLHRSTLKLGQFIE